MIDSKNFTGPDPPEWRGCASVTYFKNKLYYLGGWSSKMGREADRVDVRRVKKRAMQISNSGFN